MSRSARRPRAATFTSSTPVSSVSSSSSGSSGSTGSGRSGSAGGRHGSDRSWPLQLAGTGFGDTPPGAARRRSDARPARPRSEPRPAPVSELELALTASLDAPPGPADFAALGLPQPLVTGLQRRGITTPFPIQAATLPDALAGRDVLGRAETGSGKTLAFGLPMLARLAGAAAPPRAAARPGPGADPRARHAGAPTRSSRSATSLGLRVTLVAGGTSIDTQIERAAPRRRHPRRHPGPAERPDRARRVLELDEVEITVLDEADHMADMGFLPEVTAILDMTPAGGQRLLFSATLDRGVDKLVERYLTDPVDALGRRRRRRRSSTMDHHVLQSSRDDKVAVTAEVADRAGRTIVFVRTKLGADRARQAAARAGRRRGRACTAASTRARATASSARSATGRVPVLVATDVAARGIHVDDVGLVVHVDPPADHKDYLHRSGRTARAGESGVVVTLLLPDQRRTMERPAARRRCRRAGHSGAAGLDAVLALGRSGEPIVVRAEAPVPQPPRSGACRNRAVAAAAVRAYRRDGDRADRAPAA